MAVFQSKYRELSFYVNGERYAFSSGTFSTEDAEVIAVLETMADAERIKETKEPEEKTEEAKAPVKPAAKSKAAKSSAK